jgi:TolB-like protein
MWSQPQSSIRTQLRKVLASITFAHAERMRRFLEFIVEHALSSPGEPLKEMIIGIKLYAGHEEFDPRVTSVVRVDATRLRAKLREYYSSEGTADPLIIDLPKGSYVPVFREASTQRGSPGSSAPPINEPSIVVLPFSNLSPEPEDYFSDGLTEEIIHALSSIRGIRVVARTSAFALKHRNADVREIGRALNVGFVLEGSVRKSGAALRVMVQLASTSDGYQLWSRRYERKIEDLFAVQDEIALAIVDILRVDTANPPRHVLVNSTGNFEAYEWYLRGRHHLNRQTREEFHRAIECFEEASARSPGYTPAYGGMAVAWLYLGVFAMDAPRSVNLGRPCSVQIQLYLGRYPRLKSRNPANSSISTEHTSCPSRIRRAVHRSSTPASWSRSGKSRQKVEVYCRHLQLRLAPPCGS